MFQYYDDGPKTDVLTDNLDISVSGDTKTLSGFELVNLTPDTIADAGAWSPFLWVLWNGAAVALDWDNTKHGWYNDKDIITDKGPESLLVTAKFSSDSTTIANRPLMAGKVADVSGEAPFPPDSSAFPDVSDLPPEHIDPRDLLPFADLGSFAGNTAKSFNLSLTAHWGGEDHGAVTAFGYIATLEPPNANRLGGAHFGETLFKFSG